MHNYVHTCTIRTVQYIHYSVYTAALVGRGASAKMTDDYHRKHTRDVLRGHGTPYRETIYMA